jgi:AraC-like DNA-binding protein
MSSIALNTVKAGFEAAMLLDGIMNKNGKIARTAKIVVEPTHIVPRQSTNVLAVSDVIVAKALDFIRTNVSSQIQVSDVADSVLVSRRELERRFKKSLNNSIHQEIKLARVKLIMKMLLETSDSISEIASRLGFVDVNHIARYFKDVQGISPVEFRKKNLCAVYIGMKNKTFKILVLIFSAASMLNAQSLITGLTAKGSDIRIDLSWQQLRFSGLQGYNIYRSRYENGNYFKMNTSPHIINVYCDFLADNSRPYWYYVKPVINGVEGEMSAKVTATPYAMNDEQLLTSVQESIFRYFWDYAHPVSG